MSVATAPTDPAALAEFARAAMAEGEEERAAPLLQAAAERAGTDPELWMRAAMLHHGCERHGDAVAAFDRAAALAPADARLAHVRAHVALEAGLPAAALFEQARRLAPDEGPVLLGLADALVAEGRSADAIAHIDALVAANPGWIDGHIRLAQLRWSSGERDRATESFERVLARAPRAPLWQALIATLVQGEQYAAALDAARRGRAAAGDQPLFDAGEAVALAELGEDADAFFAKVAHIEDAAIAVRQVRHLLRTGRIDQAATLAERWTAGPGAALMWPYAATAWRLAGDARAQWLDDPRLVSVVDLADRLPPLDRLAERLRGLHHARASHLDQSVRGGTQTDGRLLCRVEPEFQALRTAVTEAVRAHIDALPPPDPSHPILGKRRDRPIRFAGSWSVRLDGEGRHINHVHPFGWFSSALYVSLPQGDAGALTLGEPPAELGLNLAPLRTIDPAPGRLVLFPSTLWHGTRPFASGERLTIAFDVAPPR